MVTNNMLENNMYILKSILSTTSLPSIATEEKNGCSVKSNPVDAMLA